MNKAPSVDQIKSKKRVAEHGEVFTNEREVKNMCDLIKNECERIESKFLEPACGNGNFLQEILSRKMTIVNKKYRSSQIEWEKNAMIAVCSLYGIELLEDNCVECRNRLLKQFSKTYKKIFKTINSQYLMSIIYILNKNIVNGDALNMKQINGSPIVFSEWNFVLGWKIKRKEYEYIQLIANSVLNSKINNSIMTLFDDEKTAEEAMQYIPKFIKDYPLVQYNNLMEAYNG